MSCCPKNMSSRSLIAASVFALASAFCGAENAGAVQFDGFLQPCQQVELASEETGILQQLLVKEGDRITAGTPVAKLSSDAEQVMFDLAEHQAHARGNYLAAEKTLEKRKAVLEEVRRMHANRHANDNELMRAELELELAEARFQVARDEMVAHEFEARSAGIRLARRTIVAPIDGVISKLHCREGEFVSPVRSDIVTIVNVDRLHAVFNVPSQQASLFESGKTFPIQCSSGEEVTATVEMIGVSIDAESGTVEVKLVVENPNGQLRAGDACVLKL